MRKLLFVAALLLGFIAIAQTADMQETFVCSTDEIVLEAPPSYYLIQPFRFKRSMDVPEIIKASFAKKYPSVDDAEWYEDGDMYTAEFFEGDFHKAAEFSASGKWLKTTTSLTFEDLLPKVQSKIEESYSDPEVSRIEKIEAAGKATVVEIEIVMESKMFVLQFDNAGKLIAETEIGEFDMDDE